MLECWKEARLTRGVELLGPGYIMDRTALHRSQSLTTTYGQSRLACLQFDEGSMYSLVSLEIYPGRSCLKSLRCSLIYIYVYVYIHLRHFVVYRL